MNEYQTISKPGAEMETLRKHFASNIHTIAQLLSCILESQLGKPGGVARGGRACPGTGGCVPPPPLPPGIWQIS